MPPRIYIPRFAKAFPHRPRIAIERWRIDGGVQSPLIRTYANSKDLPESEDNKGPNTEQLPHVSEEASGMAKSMGKEGPDLEQGTPVDEVRMRLLM